METLREVLRDRDDRVPKAAEGGPMRTATRNATEAVQYLLEYLSQTLNVEAYTERVGPVVRNYPFLSCFVIVAVLISLIPMLTFLMFLLITLFVSLAIFLVVEGSIIAVAGTVLMFVFGGCLTFAFGVTVSLAFAYRFVTGALGLLSYAQSGQRRYSGTDSDRDRNVSAFNEKNRSTKPPTKYANSQGELFKEEE